jgi:hypothetical protein
MYKASIASALSCLVATTAFATSGNGNVKEEQRSVSDFHGIQIGGGFKAEVTIGPKTSVKVFADENLLPRISTEVRDGDLVVSMNRGESIHTSSGLRLVIVTPHFDRAHASGGSTIEAEASRADSFESHSSGGSTINVKGVDADNVTIHASGAARVALEGKAKSVNISMSGGSNVDVEKLKTASANVHGSGGARARLTAGSEVAASLSGGTTLHVLGSPSKRDIKTSGGARAYYE